MKFSQGHRSLFYHCLIFLAVIIVYYPALTTFFSQDDFTHLYLSQAGSVKEWFNFFIPHNQGIFYRPLSVQLYTWLARLLFGLNPVGFHVIVLLVHLANVFLVYRIAAKLLKNMSLGLLSGLIYGVHPSHFMSLFWIAEFSMVLAPFFALMTIWDYLNGHWLRANLWFGLGLLSNELIIALPLILLAHDLVIEKKLHWNRLFLPLTLALTFVVLRIKIFPISWGSEYALSWSPVIWLTNLRWQVFRALGLPEGFLAYGSLGSIKLTLISLTLFWLIYLTKIKLKLSRVVLWGGLWFLLALGPALLFKSHQSPIYQLIGLPGLLLMVLGIIKNKQVWFWGMLFMVSAFFNIRAQDQYHWVTKRARIAEYHLEKLLRQPEQQSVIFLNSVSGSSSEVYMALAGDKAVRVFWGDEIKVRYEDFDQVTFLPEAAYIVSRVW